MKKTFLLNECVFLTIGVFLLLGCAGKTKDVKAVEGNPEALYKEGLSLFNRRSYYDALKKFETLKSNFPDSPPFTLWAELKIADCHFHRKEYIEAVAAYEEFKKLHPTYEDISYVQYQIGMSYYNQMLTSDRDQTFTKKALSNLEYLITNYPSSLFTEKAKDRIRICRERLAHHEFYIGNFYYKKGKFQAAVLRFEGLLEKFPRSSEEDKTLFFLGKSYFELGERERAKATFSKIVQEYPVSRYYKEAKAMIERGAKGKLLDGPRAKDSSETPESGADRIPLIRYDEEVKKPILFQVDKKVESKSKGVGKPKPDLSPAEGEDQKILLHPGEKVTKDTSPQATPKMAFPPGEEKKNPPQTGAPMTTEAKEKTRGEGLLPSGQAQEKSKGEGPSPPQQAKMVERDLPIDITSDKVEAFSQQNLIVFKGHVIARQKDMVIYTDFLEAVTFREGKGIEKVIARGNVRIQQGLRVAHCQEAVFYNVDQKVVLKGDPKVLEGGNLVSGHEIIWDIVKNRFEVKGGEKGRGKVKIHP